MMALILHRVSLYASFDSLMIRLIDHSCLRLYPVCFYLEFVAEASPVRSMADSTCIFVSSVCYVTPDFGL